MPSTCVTTTCSRSSLAARNSTKKAPTLEATAAWTSTCVPSLNLSATGIQPSSRMLRGKRPSPLNCDNLTGWRVLAMAVTPDDRMGLGEGHFKANKPTEIRPALPNQVTAGDSFEASFTVLNRTETPRTLEVTLSATGPLQEGASMRQILTAEPFKRYVM